ncbi:predicted protein [Micromonas commoda]|uniref:Uncharacterized protein n=1 Tax=Micromonas commoda (strain RCC299 / NOUM17 / CCMP2709) TaxID=296587 RepID=C1FDP7_MICCC|nr:predicted protein [Micromonas commoda]ACO68430.1 predicted protein [Micromonas commoda]|eukprot:XP_002507172.1 predicted protein [Micromonas commoda]
MPNCTSGDVKLTTGTERPIERTRQRRPTEGYSCIDYASSPSGFLYLQKFIRRQNCTSINCKDIPNAVA